jgi:hypothetical protein
MAIQIQYVSRTPNRHYQNRTSTWNIINKKIITENMERILKNVRKKNQITCKDKPIKVTADFSTETLKARRAGSDLF